MSVQVQFIYDTPHREVASVLSDNYQACTSAFLIAGFMTVEGIESILQPIASQPSKLSTPVVGAGTWRAFDAFDRLLSLGVAPDRLQVHLGHTRLTTSEKAPSFGTTQCCIARFTCSKCRKKNQPRLWDHTISRDSLWAD